MTPTEGSSKPRKDEIRLAMTGRTNADGQQCFGTLDGCRKLAYEYWELRRRHGGKRNRGSDGMQA